MELYCLDTVTAHFTCWSSEYFANILQLFGNGSQFPKFMNFVSNPISSTHTHTHTHFCLALQGPSKLEFKPKSCLHLKSSQLRLLPTANHPFHNHHDRHRLVLRQTERLTTVGRTGSFQVTASIHKVKYSNFNGTLCDFHKLGWEGKTFLTPLQGFFCLNFVM